MPRRSRRPVLIAFLTAACVALGYAAHREMQSSALQARFFTELTRGFAVSVEPGASPASRFPAGGPYDERLGYARIPAFVESLSRHGFKIDRQARLSPGLVRFIDWGGFPVYPEKSHAGLALHDRTGAEVYRARHPERVFPRFEDIPDLIVAALLFIENRELLDDRVPTRNPAVEWDRFAAAGVNAVASKIVPTGQRFGGSTLATQIEKYRHSPEGRTGSPKEKLRQVLSASARAYQHGQDTTAARRRIVLDYVNSTPLSARPGFGEVIGLGDGLNAWFATDLEEAARVFSEPPADADAAMRLGEVYKQILCLLLAQRRPSYYLVDGRWELIALAEAHLRLLAQEGIITPELRDIALDAPIVFRGTPPRPAPASFVERKALNAIRADLLRLTGIESFYELDRLDMRAQASIDAAAQTAVTETLRRLLESEGAKRAGLFGDRLLRGDPAGVAYSFTLYERGSDANRLRVQADSLERPLDLNSGGKLDLGSTAKLRTVTTYLEIVAELHGRYAGASQAELAQIAGDAADPLTRWAVEHLRGNNDRSLAAMVDAAMTRKYSASEAESFFTGRGAHRFANFDDRFNGPMPVREAFRHSVNLVFIRMMRDIVKYYQAEGPDPVRAVLDDPHHPARREYLERFADMEGRIFLDQFYKRYRGLDPDAALALLATRARPAPHRLATVFRSVRPEAGVEELAAFIARRMPDAPRSAKELASLHAKYGPDRFNLHDRGYIARLHPLELWLVAYLQDHPGARRSQVMGASAEVRQEVYQWLFKSKRKGAGDSRIRIIAEEDAFRKVHQSWRRQGYPFASLVPSLATAIGTSADRPAALAELMGIILNEGVRLPTMRVEAVHFAEDTPYETHLSRPAGAPERVLPREVAAALRAVLADVVEQGTARRLSGVYRGADGEPLVVGGKTGTGDELADRYGPGTEAGRGKEVSRSAAFAFFLGERFFGVITAHVPGVNAAGYRFTSALPTQVLKALEPALAPLLSEPAPAPRPAPGQRVAAAAQ